MLSADSIKNTLIYPYNKNKLGTLMHGFGNVVKSVLSELVNI